METIETLQHRVSELERAVARLTTAYTELECMSVSQREAAQRLGINEKTIRRYRELGLIHPLPGTTRYGVGEIRRFAGLHLSMDNYDTAL